MAEVTRVPLQPIEKGSLAKFWLGLLVGIALTSAVAWFTTRPASVSIDTLTAGEGASPVAGDIVFVDYTGRLDDGTVFDQSTPAPPPPAEIADLIPQGTFMEVDGVVPGFREGLLQMQKGGSYTVEIPAELAYGEQGSSNPATGEVVIPPNSDLTFDVTLHDFMTQDELQERGMQIQIIMSQVQEAAAAAEAAE